MIDPPGELPLDGVEPGDLGVKDFAVLALCAAVGPGEHTRAGRTLSVQLLQPNVAQDEKFALDRMPDTLQWVAARLLARSEELELLAAGIRELPMLNGWRFDVFGRDALELVEGKMAFAVVHGKLKMTRVEAAVAEVATEADEAE